MRTLLWSPAFSRSLLRRVRRDPQVRASVEPALRQRARDPFHPSLHSHKLKGELAGVWACTVNYDLRILFEFVSDAEGKEDAILLLALGTHDEVY